MDWFSWLSKTNLDPLLVYEYGLEFVRNELQEEDITYFNHEFLQSMGISVAKHRLEILKVARKEAGKGPIRPSRLILAINKTKKGLQKCISKWVFPEVSALKTLPEPARYGDQWKEALTRRSNTDIIKVERPPTPTPTLKIRRQVKSGPLERMMMEEKLMINDSRSLKLSGPVDVKANDRLVFEYGSPKLCGRTEESLVIDQRRPDVSKPTDERPLSPKPYGEENKEIRVVVVSGGSEEDHLLWATLFQDIEPT